MTDRELMQMARRALELRCNDADGNEVDLVTPAIKALRDRLAQPELEPENLELYLESLVDLCNNSIFFCNADEVISAEAALERLYQSRKLAAEKIKEEKK